MHRRTALIFTGCVLSACAAETSPPEQRQAKDGLRVVRQALDGGVDMPPNTPPTATDDAVTVDEDGMLEIEVLSNDDDADGDELTVFITETASEGTLVAGDGNFVYSPRANFNGTDSFTYGVLDGRGGSDEASVEITVTAVNDPPVFIPPTPPNFGTINAAVGVSAEFQMAAEDIESDALMFGVDDFGTSGEPSVSGGSFSWTPGPDDVGIHDVTIFVSDGTDRAERQITIDVSDGPGGPELCGTDRCGDGETCMGEECVTTCESAADCSADQQCMAGGCVDDLCAAIRCDPGSTCTAGVCFPDCDRAADCPAGLDCYDGRCAEEPCEGITCAAGESCFAGRCGASCNGNDACVADTSCYIGVCLGETDGFCDGVSCAAGSTCAGGLCTVCEGGDCGDGREDGPQFENGGCGCGQSGDAGVAGSALIALLMLTFVGFRRLATAGESI